MRERRDILEDLISLNADLTKLGNELLLYPWDIEEPIVQMRRKVFSSVLEKFLANEKFQNEIEEWANLIECREDIEFENDDLKEYIYELANPILTGNNTRDKVERIFNQVNSQSPPPSFVSHESK